MLAIYRQIPACYGLSFNRGYLEYSGKARLANRNCSVPTRNRHIPRRPNLVCHSEAFGHRQPEPPTPARIDTQITSGCRFEKIRQKIPCGRRSKGKLRSNAITRSPRLELTGLNTSLPHPSTGHSPHIPQNVIAFRRFFRQYPGHPEPPAHNAKPTRRVAAQQHPGSLRIPMPPNPKTPKESR